MAASVLPFSSQSPVRVILASSSEIVVPGISSARSALPASVSAANNDTFTYIYLSSVAHSGSTLVGCLLGAHPEISTVGEFGAVLFVNWNYRCTCGETLATCDFWQRWKREAERCGIDFDPGAFGVNALESRFGSFWHRLYCHQFAHPSLDRLRDMTMGRWSQARRDIEAGIEKGIRLARMLCQLDGTKVFLDTAKYPHQVRLLAKNTDLDLRVISLVRDGRGVMNSLMHRYGHSAEKAVEDVVWSTKHRLRAEKNLPPERIFRLRLEDLCAEPDQTIRHLRRFVGVAADVDVVYARENLHILGNTTRMKFDGGIRQDESWKTRLSQEHLDLFETRAGRLNRRLGYED